MEEIEIVKKYEHSRKGYVSSTRLFLVKVNDEGGIVFRYFWKGGKFGIIRFNTFLQAVLCVQEILNNPFLHCKEVDPKSEYYGCLSLGSGVRNSFFKVRKVRNERGIESCIGEDLFKKALSIL